MRSPGVMRRFRGLSLVEVIVVLGLFASLMVVVAALQHQSARASRQSERADDSYRQALQISAHMQNLLRQARVAALAPNRLDLDLPRSQDGVPLLQPDGTPVFERVVVTTVAQSLVLQRTGQADRALARLGPRGRVTFAWMTGVTAVLEIQVLVDTGSDPMRQEQLRFSVPNQGR